MFACSLVLRALDEPVCAWFAAGTHFGWHLLNAVVLYLAGHALISRWRQGSVHRAARAGPSRAGPSSAAAG